MHAREARQATQYARRCLREAWLTLLDVYERDGWRSLGYSSWHEYATVEFEISRTHAYRLLAAATIQRDFAHQGRLPEDAPHRERHLRELARLPTAELRRLVWEEARADGCPTAASLGEIVSIYQGNLGSETERLDSADDDPDPRPRPGPRFRPARPDYRARAAAHLEEIVPTIRRAGAIGRRALPHLQHALSILRRKE